ncbi:peptide-binding protein [Brevundimonas sp. Leaf363]|uniref:SH3 domain-containing protein n=1 Tax=Brevundimonas sp. Leaf363 TaxID=1736353 RepID=UPI0006F3F60B|nr:SH3 domain-containing protein [Brevundimonas sp. Leaf363]KQS55748.1 peptide-binding protein [Brevundimonas sp. Leaf363]RZJ43565.1 MAG: SH3 domain-containing protein [Brevundimonas sp.]
MSKSINSAFAVAAALATLVTAAPMAANAQANGVTNCDAPGGRQRAGALIGAVLGGVVGSNLARNERTAGTIVGAGAGAAAGSYIGCNQQRARAASVSSGGAYRATANLNVRSGPGTGYRTVSRLSAGQPFSAVSSQGEWVQIAGGGWVNANYVAAN